jgi:hypothetical protein
VSPVVDEAERQLATLRAARDAVMTNLLDLEAEGAYSLLKAGNGLTGVTAARARPALARVAELWGGLQLLDNLLERADALRPGGRLSDDRARELLALLTGPSIDLPATIRPLAQRALTASPVATPAVTAQGLLTDMEAAFAPLRDVVAAVDAAWNDLLPRVERADAEATTLEAESPGAVASARSALRTAADRVAQDPLGAAGDLARAESLLTGARQAAAQVRAQRARVAEELVAADDLVGRISALVDEGRIGLGDSRRTIRAPAGLLDPLDPTVITGDRGLQPWLDRLQALVDEGDVARAADGLGHWRRVADETLVAAQQVATANAGPAARRRELRGLLRAARAKALAAGRVDDPRLRRLEETARLALVAPCDLADAEQRVDAYVTALRPNRRRKEESV